MSSLTIDDLIAREEIRDTLINYSQGLDQRNWELYDRAWAPGGTFEGVGIPPTPASEFKAMLQSNNDGDRISGQHLLSNTHFDIEGDSAHTVTEFLWITHQTMDKPNMVFQVFGGGLYVDDLIKTDDGWRILKRVAVTKHKETRGMYMTDEQVDEIRANSLKRNWFTSSQGHRVD